MEVEVRLMKYLVTGATGHIGNVLVKLLASEGHEVHAICLPKDAVFMIDAVAQIHYGNILDQNFLLETIQGFDGVFHLAGMVDIGTGRKKTLQLINVQGTINVVNASIQNHIPKLVYTSSVHAMKELPHGQTMTEVDEFDPSFVHGAYAKSKAEATAYVLAHQQENFDVFVVQPSGVIGPQDYKISSTTQLFMDCMMGRLSAYLKGGYNFVDVRDVAMGMKSVMTMGKPGQCYILSGHEITVKQLLDQITTRTTKRPVKTVLAYWFILVMSYFAEGYYHVLRQRPLFTHYSVKVLRSNYAFSNQKAQSELAFHPRPLEETIHDTIEFVKNTYLDRRNNRYWRKPKLKNKI